MTGKQELALLNDEMKLNNPILDQMHDELLELLQKLKGASVENVLLILDEIIAHTESHFALEESWMARINFPAAGCHINEHNQVIGVMRLVRERVKMGEIELVYVLEVELSTWLCIHVTTMDYALVNFIQVTGAESL